MTVPLTSHFLTVALLLCAFDLQVDCSCTFCQDIEMDHYKCQCDSKMQCQKRKNTLQDCQEEQDCVRGISAKMCMMLGGSDCQGADGCNLTNCVDPLREKFDCMIVDSCNGQPCNEDEDVWIPLVVCLTAIILLIIITVMLSFYWKFKIKVLRETRRNNTYEVSTLPQSREDPLYSVLNPCVTPGCMESPQLPPSRVPYYQEIASDEIGAAKEPSYAMPPHPMPHADHEQERDQLNEGYQEPIDALRMEEPSLKQENASTDPEKK